MDADLKSRAVAGAKRFADVWEFKDFWKRSNTFHSLLRLVDAAEHRWPRDPALREMHKLRAAMAEKNAQYFKGIFDDPSHPGNVDGVWADDFGWCGLACVEASRYLTADGNSSLGTQYERLAMRCWELMKEIGYDSTDTATPVRHGCGNVSKQRKREDPRHPYGTRNTVTNANLLLLSLRLYWLVHPDPSDHVYLDMAIKQLAWFGEWFSIAYKSLDDGPYLRTNGAAGLIHERPRAETAYMEDAEPVWERGWVWTGDQGLLLMALAELLLQGHRIPGVDMTVYRNAFNALVAGAEMLLFGEADGVLREPPFHSSFDAEFARDYVGGRGVLLRYMSEPLVTQAAGRRLHPSGIAATADAVWKSRDASDQFASLWSGDKIFNQKFVESWGSGDANIKCWTLDIHDEAYHGVLQANGLDALTAAMRLPVRE